MDELLEDLGRATKRGKGNWEGTFLCSQFHFALQHVPDPPRLVQYGNQCVGAILGKQAKMQYG